MIKKIDTKIKQYPDILHHLYQPKYIFQFYQEISTNTKVEYLKRRHYSYVQVLQTCSPTFT